MAAQILFAGIDQVVKVSGTYAKKYWNKIWN